jgi:hypothetical protein
LVQKTITDNFFASGSGVEGIYPYSFHITPWMSWSGSGGTNAPTRNAGTSYVGLGRIYNGTGADGDYVQWNVELAAGTWSIKSIYATAASAGIGLLQLDGATVATIDFYAASGVNNVTTTTTGVTVATSGAHTLKLLISGKHASSTDYYYDLSSFSGVRTGA